MPIDTSIIGVEWLNGNALRKFPIADDASCLDTTNTFKIPEDFIVDLILPVSTAATFDPDGFFISQIAVFGQGVVIVISYQSPSGKPFSSGVYEVGRVAISSNAHNLNDSYFLQGTGNFTDTIGKITVGTLDTIISQAGVYNFDISGTKLVATTIRPDIRAVSSFKIMNGTDASDPIYGDIMLVAGQNIKLEVSGSDITINAIDGANLNVNCDCQTVYDTALSPCIRTVNGVKPNSNGNITISTSTCLSVNPVNTNTSNSSSGSSTQGGITITDLCSTPCCTSEQINTLLKDQTQLAVDIRTQGVTLIQLESKMSQLDSLEAAIRSTGFILG